MAKPRYTAEQVRQIQEMLGQQVGMRGGKSVSGIKKFLSSKGGKIAGGELLGFMILDRLMRSGETFAEQGLQREAIQGQAALASPENLYYQAALPQAQQESETARQALYAQISGGVIGPTLAHGERMI